MLVKLATNFPKDGQRIAVIGTNKIVKQNIFPGGAKIFLGGLHRP